MTTASASAHKPLTTSREAARLAARQRAWKPRLTPFYLAFLVIFGFSLWSFKPNPSPLGWALTIVWSLPVVGVLIGFQGVLMVRRRLRKVDEMVPPAPAEDDFLIVLVPTIGRHDTYPALERSVLSYVEHLPSYFPWIRIDILTEEGCAAAQQIDDLAARSELLRVVTVPKAYQTPNGTKFKARANHYSHELRIEEGEAEDDVWVLHMDDDTGVGPDTAAATAQFINRQRRAGEDAKHMAQGILTYPRENAVSRFTWLADAIRPADDIARFRAMTGTGTPVAGVHGELLLVRSSVEASIGWDFGPDTIVEDAQLALNFCLRYPGRSDWFNGRCYGASPAGIRDFVKQRERWAWGLVALCFNPTIPLRFRLFIGMGLVSWVMGPLQHVGLVLIVAWFTGSMNTSPVTQSVTFIWAINFAYVIWTYWEGLRLNVVGSVQHRRKWWEPIVVVAAIPVFSFIEGLGGLRGLIKFLRREENKFVVIAKPA